MHYQALRKGLNSKTQLIPYPADLSQYVKDQNQDYYVSLYQYNEQQFNAFKQNGSIAGIRDVTTNRLYWDFDSKDNIEQAKEDAWALCERLENEGIDTSALNLYWSGGKGLNVELYVDKRLTPSEFKAITNTFAMGLETFDTVVADPNRIIRLENTKHQSSGLYKICLTPEQFQNLTIDNIKELASKPSKKVSKFIPVKINPEKYLKPEPKKETTSVITSAIDYSNKPKEWPNCKWSLMNGDIKAGDRNKALMILAATCRAKGWDRDFALSITTTALHKSWDRYGQGGFDENELEKNVIDVVYANNWNGGAYTCNTPGWLQDHCESLGVHKCDHREEEKPVIEFNDMASHFGDYATNFQQNIIKCGLKDIDDNVSLMAYTLNGLLGQPGSGKTSFSLNYLRNASMNNIPSLFFSMDMAMPVVFAKLVQKETKYDFKKVMDVFKYDKKQAQELTERIKHDYRNVGFNFRTGQTVDDIRRTIYQQEQRTGTKTKLVILDYLECIGSNFSDATASSGAVAGKLKDLANDAGVCILLLLQTQKHSTTEVSDPLLSLKMVKGSSVIEQNMSTILTTWREGYSPNTVVDDKFISFAVVKNRFGPLWKGDFAWEGVTGNIRSLLDEEYGEIAALRAAKELAKKAKNDGWE